MRPVSQKECVSNKEEIQHLLFVQIFLLFCFAREQGHNIKPDLSDLPLIICSLLPLRPEAGTCRDLLPAYGKGYSGMAEVAKGREQQPFTPMSNSCGAV